MNCPTWPWHGSGPFPDKACYWCLKRAVLEGEPASEDARRFAGFDIPARRDPAWRPPRASTFDVLAALERTYTHRLSDGTRALAAALQRLRAIGEEPA